MTKYYPYLYDVACEASLRQRPSEARGPKAWAIVQYIQGLNTNMDIFHTYG